MIKRFLFWAVSILIFLSCENKEPVDFLTDGTWILDKDIASTTSETLKFDSNGKYLFVSEYTMHSQLKPMSGSASGEYYRQGDEIHFTSTKIGLPEGTSKLPDFEDNWIGGLPIGSLYNLNRWRNDSVFTDSLDRVYIDVLPPLSNPSRIWVILNLTNDSLKVESDSIIIKYYKQ